jgi:small subunit ribosomal protein S16
MLTIRFNRTGKNKRAAFRIVAQEHTIAPGGRHVEILGSYDPHQKKAVLRAERIKYWMEKGARVSDPVFNLLIREKMIEGKKRTKKIPKPKVEEKAPEKAETKPVDAIEGAKVEEAKEAAVVEEKKEDIVA